MTQAKWQFWIDRGGTFTDIVAQRPDGQVVTHKLLSENPAQYQDAAIQGIRDVLGVAADQPVPVEQIGSVRMGTTVATNALLEHKGEPLLLVTTRGFADALRIAYQQRPDLFALDIRLPQMLYQQVVEVNERIRADGQVEMPLDRAQARQVMQAARESGLRAVAIVLMHAWRYPQHEQALVALAREMGFEQISASHQVSPLIRFVSRGDTTVVDAYLSPVLRRYVQQVTAALPQTELLFMQSSGGLTPARDFQGKDAVLSGPAGGVVGMVSTAQAAGFEALIGFDMGGTSTDVCHFQGATSAAYERATETLIAGVRISTPMLRVHTVAAGGSSILRYEQGRLRVGPESAGSRPGPAAYRRGGPLTITDCNVLLGKLQPDYFPALFGEQADQTLDRAEVQRQFAALAQQSGQAVEALAEGFITVAVENMANAIKKISVQRGYDVSEYTLCSYGGAGGQHACQVADTLGMSRVFLHAWSGVLSAFGMGLAQIRKIARQSVDLTLGEQHFPALQEQLAQLQTRLRDANVTLLHNTPDHAIQLQQTLYCHYQGSDSELPIAMTPAWQTMREHFHQQHRLKFGFAHNEQPIHISRIEIELVVAAGQATQCTDTAPVADKAAPCDHRPVYLQGQWRSVPFYQRHALPADTPLHGPAIILEPTGTVVVEAGWQAVLKFSSLGSYLLLERYQAQAPTATLDTRANPVMLEVFNKRFMSIAEQMGFVLENTAVSVNIKERLDFSCAIFDARGALVANAPHMPVHLGSMSESIKAVMRDFATDMQPGDAFVLNDPYNGGTHLPDITVIRPVFLSELATQAEAQAEAERCVFYVAARGHHVDIGGVTPGSIPPDSQVLEEEGILIKSMKLVRAGEFQEQAIRKILGAGSHPARNIDCNIADLQAQLAACHKGVAELDQLVAHYGLPVVEAYMCHVQDNAEAAVREVIAALHEGEFSCEMDDGSRIQVSIRVNPQQRTASIDFSGTSPQHPGNLNAPVAITKAAVLYVFRTLVNRDIPLNEGCLKPLQLTIPAGCMLNPQYPAAVVAGNVETSQAVVDCLYGALQVMAASQGTMNNVTWGNARYQYYETLCGGAGATPRADGADAVHTHMTNSRLTDPEILEQRFPVLLDEFSIRPHSGGAGRYQGGCGVVRKTRFLEPMTVNILSGHRRIAPYGMAGGHAGKTGENSVSRQSGKHEPLAFKDRLQVGAGDTLVIKTPGGGGYGKPG